MRRLATVLITAVIIPLLNCCTISYKFNGSAIDYNVYKTIHVGQFPIRAALVYPPLQQMFENALLDYIARNTRLQIVDTQNTDITLDGEITGYNLSPQAVSENAIAAETRLTISVRIKYTDSKNDKNNVDQTFSAYKDFDSNEMLTDVQDDLCQQITEQLIDLIFNATLGNW
ncbi:LptE family protein [uncultured Muribaculum sp.]|jgi:outer membrane lipopolysaccharide assembly protein LptE/RlpB|uniref:LptE family protein n=1 Tax=uncultured Muribaculum sp. TaxID=1918613 RepID=UPI0025AF611A|nr:LptE family protein [uncultured Muribaculum sp.]